MAKYFDTKPGSLEEAVSRAQQAAIAISKKEKEEKSKNEDQGQFSFVAAQAKKNGEKKFTFAGKEFEVEKVECPKCEGKGCDHCENKGYHEEGFNINEGFFSKEYEPGQFKKGDEKPFVDAIKKGGGKNIDVQTPNRREPMLTIEFDGDVKKIKTMVSKVGDGTEEIDESINEKVEYVEYKFKNKNDAMAAKKMLDATNLMSFDINDDNISGGELMVDAGSKDMTKFHKEIMTKFKPKVMKSETNKNDKSDDGDGLDAVQPKAVKKKFDDRKDKDIDNDGDVDSSDKFLHKRRKAISKSMGESLISVAESVRMMWDEAAKKTESQDMEQDKDGDGMDDDGKAKKTKEKTDSGKDMTPVETSVKMPKVKNEKNKV